MTPPPADPVPLPAAKFCPAGYAVPLEGVRTYGDSRERAGLARGVAEERARVVAWLRSSARGLGAQSSVAHTLYTYA